MNYRSFSATVVSVLLILLYQNCGNDAQSVRSTSSSPSTSETPDSGNGTVGSTTGGSTSGGTTSGGSTSGGTTSGGSTSGGTTSGGSTSGGTTSGGSTTGGTSTANVFPSSFNFNFRRADPIVMPINSLMPLPYDVTGEFTVISIVSSDLFRIRKYLGNTIDIGTKIPVMARRGATSINLTFNHVATEYLRDRAIISLMSQANPNVLPQQITITIEPRNTDIVDAFQGIYPGDTMTKTYDGKLFTARTGSTNLATQGKIHFNKGIYPTYVQELPDGRTFITTIETNNFNYSQLLSRGIYLNEKISFFSSTSTSIGAFISEDKTHFYIGGSTGTTSDYLPLNTRYPSPVGPLKAIFQNSGTRTMMLAESGKVYSVPYTYDNANRRLIFSTPVEINFGNPVIQGFTTFDGNGLARVALVTSNNRIYIQDSRSSVPSTLMIDLSTEQGVIDELVMGLYDAQSTAYVRFSTGKHYSITFNSNTAVVSSRSPSVHNPDFLMTSSAWNNNYYMIDHRTGASVTSPIR